MQWNPWQNFSRWCCAGIKKMIYYKEAVGVRRSFDSPEIESFLTAFGISDISYEEEKQHGKYRTKEYPQFLHHRPY